MDSFKEKTAIITRATSGIGLATGLLFAKFNMNVVAASRNEEKGTALVDEITKTGGNAIFVITDVSKEGSVKSLVNKAKSHFGNLHFVINNAAIEGPCKTISDITEKDWDLLMNINLKGVWLCMKHALPILVQNNEGCIVNISSWLTKLHCPETSLYTASKAGVEGLTKTAALEFGKYNIRINAISPGVVDTPMIHRIHTQQNLKKLKEANPLKKIAEAKDIANTALWLCSSMASHVNGAIIAVDGGSAISRK